MAVIESHSSPIGTHPSFASSCTKVQCDECGDEFTADCRIDDEWQLHNEVVGMTDRTGGEPQELCQRCVYLLFGEPDHNS